MAISKLIFNGVTQMDVTQDTVAAANLLSGETATGADGEQVVGAYVPASPTLQTKSVSYMPTESAQSESVTPSAGYDGLDKVNVSVGAIDSEYVGSDVPRKSSSDLSASGATVTAPAGYYESAASKAVASGSASTPATSITANPSISVDASGLITATASASQSVTPTVSAGYVASGTAGTVSVSGSATQQLSTQSATTITPTTSSQTAVSAGKYTTGAVTVDPIPSQYIVPTGTKTITENGTGIDVAAYAAVDVNVSGGGGANTLEQRFKNTLTTFSMDGDVTFPSFAFNGCSALTSVSFPDITSITNQYVFGSCSNLESCSMPELASIGSSASYAFERCTKLSAIFPKLTTIAGGYAFSRVNGPIVFPALTSLTGSDMFRSGGTIVDFGPGLTSLATRTFYGATYTTVILRCATQVVVSPSDNSISALDNNTTVYIPKALYDHLGDGTALDYRNATNWSAKTTTTFACIEGSQYENYYADGTPIPTT